MATGKFRIKRLSSGGLITNYFCTSNCRHCLYNCSPEWPKDYISEDTARENFQKIKSLGCHSVHIGGGEPLLRPDKLVPVLKAASEAGMHIDYVETNSSWFRGPESADKTLSRLKEHGVETLLISISPFHNEHIPFARVQGVVASVQRSGIGLFPWIEDFVPDLRAFDPARIHKLEEFEAHFGGDYLHQVLRRYWMHLGGRALKTFRKVLPEKPLAQILDSAGSTCAAELSDTSHFHLDLYGNYIPGLCSGLAIARGDLGENLSANKYPLLSCLYRKGIRGLYELAWGQYDFRASRENYINKCEVCTEIRSHLIKFSDKDLAELQPSEFYLQN